MRIVVRNFWSVAVVLTFALAACEEGLTPAGEELMRHATHAPRGAPATSTVSVVSRSAPLTTATAPASGPRTQWIVRVDIGTRPPDGYSAWKNHSRAPHESFMNGARDALQALTDQNPHCTITAMTAVNALMGWQGVDGGPYTLPSGILAAFHCPNGEPLNTAR